MRNGQWSAHLSWQSACVLWRERAELLVICWWLIVAMRASFKSFTWKNWRKKFLQIIWRHLADEMGGFAPASYANLRRGEVHGWCWCTQGHSSCLRRFIYTPLLRQRSFNESDVAHWLKLVIIMLKPIAPYNGDWKNYTIHAYMPRLHMLFSCVFCEKWRLDSW